MTPSPRDRLFRGYGPLIGFTALFLAIAVLVPSQQREVRVEPLDQSALLAEVAEADEGTEATETEVGAATEEAAAPADEGPAPDAGPTETAPPATAPPSTTGCPDRELQVPGDPYSPPCTTFSGDNGGATSRGVTGDTITVAVRPRRSTTGCSTRCRRSRRPRSPTRAPR